MYVPEELKLNRFKDVKIPSNKDYFQRLGRQALPDGQYTGDNPALMPSSKVDQVTAAEQALFDQMRQDEINAQRDAALKAQEEAKKAAEVKAAIEKAAIERDRKSRQSSDVLSSAQE